MAMGVIVTLRVNDVAPSSQMMCSAMMFAYIRAKRERANDVALQMMRLRRVTKSFIRPYK